MIYCMRVYKSGRPYYYCGHDCYKKEVKLLTQKEFEDGKHFREFVGRADMKVPFKTITKIDPSITYFEAVGLE